MCLSIEKAKSKVIAEKRQRHKSFFFEVGGGAGVSQVETAVHEK